MLRIFSVSMGVFSITVNVCILLSVASKILVECIGTFIYHATLCVYFVGRGKRREIGSVVLYVMSPPECEETVV